MRQGQTTGGRIAATGRRGRGLLAGALALLAAMCGSAAAADLAGSTLSIGAKRVPLPAAEWALLSAATLTVGPRAAGAATPIESAVAASAEDRTVRYLAVVRANPAPAAAGFGLDPACRRLDLHSARIVSKGGSVVAVCTFVGHVLQGAPANGDPAWAAALAAAARTGQRLPATWLVVGVRIADGGDLLDVRYYFNPEAIGFPEAAMPPPAAPGWPGRAGDALADFFGHREPPHDPRWLASAWSVDGVARDRRRAAVVRALEAWSDAAHRAVYTGFKGGAVDDLAPPLPWADLSSTAATAAGGGLPGERALWKTLSWRAVGSSLDAAVSYVFTGSIGVAGGITVVGGMVNAAVYYVHEKAWEVFGAERGPGDRLTAVPAAGIER